MKYEKTRKAKFKNVETSQGGDSDLSYIAVNLQPQGTSQVEIENCMSIFICKSIKPVKDDSGDNL